MSKRGNWNKSRAFVETQCADGTLVKIGHFGQEMRLLGKTSA